MKAKYIMRIICAVSFVWLFLTVDGDAHTIAHTLTLGAVFFTSGILGGLAHGIVDDIKEWNRA